MSTNLFYGIPILFFALFAIVFLLATGVIVAVIVALVKRKKNNDSAPQLTVNATVATKRTQVSGGKNDLGMGASTWYYVTFQVESGDRMELCVTGADYGLLAEGDKGRLTFQGTRFIRFERDLY